MTTRGTSSTVRTVIRGGREALLLALCFAVAASLAWPAAHPDLAAIMQFAIIPGLAALPFAIWSPNAPSINRLLLIRIFGMAAAAFAGAMIARGLVPSAGDLPMGALLLGDALAVLIFVATIGRASRNPAAMLRVRGPVKALVVGSRDAALSFITLAGRNGDLRLNIVGCVDDDARTKSVAGVPLIGSVADLHSLITRHRIEVVVVTVTNPPDDLLERVKAACLGVEDDAFPAPIVRVIPGVATLLQAQPRHIGRIVLKPEEVLPREAHRTDTATVRPHIENQVVLVTGAGGSIGSEISRQIADLRPKQLLILGHGESSLFALQQELQSERKLDSVKMILADVVDEAAIRAVFAKYRPNIVFHAAAHKHVPILEDAPCQAVQNNIIGTNNVALAAAASGAAKFILLSTDKAVNPTSIMGATKRVAELICQSFAQRTATEFVAVRFGNVLGSRGSVLPIFCRQVEQGGPVTITHRDMERYFMTIPEAVSLVLQAMAIGRDGKVFVLDMGKPVKILELAERVIRLSGYIPHHEIEIVEIGIRPGEKLYEETLTSGEGLTQTSHERLYIAQQERLDYNLLATYLQKLAAAVRLSDWQAIVRLLVDLVPSYTPDERLRIALAPPSIEAVPCIGEELEVPRWSEQPDVVTSNV
jgi:FlaA1/EpsC-like NDP-sugar epimerase